MAFIAFKSEPPVVVTSSTRITLSPSLSSPSMSFDVPKPYFSFLIIKRGFRDSSETAVAIGTAPRAGPAIF